MKYLVTGCSGFIGSYLVKKILENKDNIVIGIDNMNNYYDISIKEDRLNNLKRFSNFIFYKEDISNKKEVFEIFDKEQPDYVINLAAQAGVRYSIEHPDCYINSNIIGFYNILEACRNYPVKRLIFASSSSVYGGNKKVPFSTTDQVDKPISLYAATKKSNELMAYTYSSLYHIKAIGLRFFTVYGPNGRPDMAYYSFTKNIIEGKTIKVFNNGKCKRDFTYIDDIIEGILLTLNVEIKPDENDVLYKIYNLGSEHPIKLTYFIELLEKYIGRKAKKEFLPMQAGDVYETYADMDDFVQDTGFKPKTSFEDGLKEFVDWYLKNMKGKK